MIYFLARNDSIDTEKHAVNQTIRVGNNLPIPAIAFALDGIGPDFDRMLAQQAGPANQSEPCGNPRRDRIAASLLN